MSNSQWDWLMQELRPAWSLYPDDDWPIKQSLFHTIWIWGLLGVLSRKVGQKWADTQRGVWKPWLQAVGAVTQQEQWSRERTTERLWQHEQRKQRQSVAESPYWQSNREGATDAHCWSSVKKNRWLEIYYVLSDIPSSARQLLKLLPALSHFLVYPYNTPRSRKSPEPVSSPGNLKEPHQHHVIFISLLWHISGGIIMICFYDLSWLNFWGQGLCALCLFKTSSATRIYMIT